MSLLERAREALEGERHAEALAVALEAWRESRHEDIGAVITWLQLRLAPEPDLNDADNFQARWLAAARGPRSATNNGWLGATLQLALPSRDTLRPLGDEPLIARLAALVQLEADPRLADAALGIVDKGRIHDVRVFESCGRIFERHGDRRHVRALRKLVLVRRKLRIDRLEADELHMSAFRLERMTRPGDSDADWRQLLPPPPPGQDAGTRAKAAAIVAQLYDDPFDEELCSVCADQLLELGDPLGEFIALQRLEKPGPEARRRMRELQSAHQDEWLGPDLSSVLSAVRFRDGFPVHATLAPSSHATGSVWQRALGDHRLATIEVLHRGKAARWRHDEFLDAIHSLRNEEE